MTYKLTIIQKPTYLHFIVTGTNNEENVVRCFEDIHRECTARNCSRILVEKRLSGSCLEVLDVFSIAREASIRGKGLYKAIAYVDLNAPENSLLKFAEDIASTRSFPLVVFTTVAEAKKWLMNENQ
jgi:hypothetical protein